jgi:hypothetical protein
MYIIYVDGQLAVKTDGSDFGKQETAHFGICRVMLRAPPTMVINDQENPHIVALYD